MQTNIYTGRGETTFRQNGQIANGGSGAAATVYSETQTQL